MSNNPPESAQYYIDQLEGLKDRVTQWSQTEINGENAGALRDLIGDIKNVAKAAEKDRKATKEPYLEQGRKIDKDFKPVASLADDFVKPLTRALSEFMALEERRRREEAERARIEAEKKAAAAEALKEDEFAGDFAQAQAEQAEVVAKRAERAADNTSVKGSDSDRAMGLRTYRKAKIINGAMLVGHFANNPDVIALCEKLANAEIRAAKGGEVSIPGIEIVEEKRAA